MSAQRRSANHCGDLPSNSLVLAEPQCSRMRELLEACRLYFHMIENRFSYAANVVSENAAAVRGRWQWVFSSTAGGRIADMTRPQPLAVLCGRKARFETGSR